MSAPATPPPSMRLRQPAYDLWLYRAIYFEDNQRIRQFVSHGEFVPLVDRWVALKELL